MEHAQIEPLEVEAAQVAAVQDCEQPGGYPAKRWLVSNVAIREAVDRRRLGRDGDSWIKAPRAVVVLAIRQELQDANLG
jgi:hypothetical protein